MRESGQVDSPKLKAVKEIFAVLDENGTMAGVETMLRHCHEDVELRLYFANGRPLHGTEEVRAFFLERQSSGATVHPSAWSFEERGDSVIVPGSIRVHREDGSIADAQLRWRFHFREGLIDHAEFEPLGSAVR